MSSQESTDVLTTGTDVHKRKYSLRHCCPHKKVQHVTCLRKIGYADLGALIQFKSVQEYDATQRTKMGMQMSSTIKQDTTKDTCGLRTWKSSTVGADRPALPAEKYVTRV
eukprot:9476921-Pyramimonas_sp.AAC.1